MPDSDTASLQREALAITARLRREGLSDIADVVERWVESADLRGQLVFVGGRPRNQTPPSRS